MSARREREMERESECADFPRKPHKPWGAYGPGDVTCPSNPKEEPEGRRERESTHSSTVPQSANLVRFLWLSGRSSDSHPALLFVSSSGCAGRKGAPSPLHQRKEQAATGSFLLAFDQACRMIRKIACSRCWSVWSPGLVRAFC